MTFTLYPAIDLKGGQVVRLRRGEMDQATVYADDPARQARAFIEAGFAWLHVVDLDGAFAGRPANAEAVRAILAAVPGAKVQLGGGIRSMAVAEAWLAAGVSRIILGSAAVKEPAGPSPAASPSASTRGRGWSRPKAGPRPATSPPPTSPAGSRTRARRR
jgi:phosphoribosylformimino-5-aminoimidazole carboxamide ribotide isomerase